MKRLSMLLFFAGSFGYPQTPPVPVTAEEFTFKKRLQWYAKITYTDPGRLGWLVGEVTADDFLFGGIEKWGSGLSGWGKSLAVAQGQRVIANTTELFIGQLIGDDARYRPSGKKAYEGGFGTRRLTPSRQKPAAAISDRLIPAASRLLQEHWWRTSGCRIRRLEAI
jgi:hypothetical protein